MCFHSKREVKEALAKASLRGRKDVSVVIMRSPTNGRFQEAYYCSVTDPQQIANTIRNLRAWHPGERLIDLTQLNDVRVRQFHLHPIEERDLPPPTGKAPKSEEVMTAYDEDVDRSLRQITFDPAVLAVPRDKVLADAADADAMQKTKRALEHALKNGFPESKAAQRERDDAVYRRLHENARRAVYATSDARRLGVDVDAVINETKATAA